MHPPSTPPDIRVDWETYSILPEGQDDKLIDLVLRIGDPFPLLEETVAQCLSTQRSYKSSLNHNSAVGRRGQSVEQELKVTSSKTAITGSQVVAKDIPPSSSTNMLSEDGGIPSDWEFKEEPLIRSFLVVHEGVRSSYPYTIEPEQVILPARGYATLAISFMPSLEALKAHGRRQEAYALGYMTLDDSCAKVHTYVVQTGFLHICVCTAEYNYAYTCVCMHNYALYCTSVFTIYTAQ